jgi:hypothetical protein
MAMDGTVKEERNSRTGLVFTAASGEQEGDETWRELSSGPESSVAMRPS